MQYLMSSKPCYFTASTLLVRDLHIALWWFLFCQLAAASSSRCKMKRHSALTAFQLSSRPIITNPPVFSKASDLQIIRRVYCLLSLLEEIFTRVGIASNFTFTLYLPSFFSAKSAKDLVICIHYFSATGLESSDPDCIKSSFALTFAFRAMARV